jgi:hypothetical protein
VTEGRLHELAATAIRTGELFVELLVRLRAEQARNLHMGPDGCLTKAASSLYSLHRAAQRYREVRRDDDLHEFDLIGQAINQQHGPGITALVLKALGAWREAVSKLPFPVSDPGEKQ